MDISERVLDTISTYARFVDPELNTPQEVLVENVLILARRLGTTTFPPTFARFGTESGPLDPLPDRSRVPFPTIDDMRFSILNVKTPKAFSLPSSVPVALKEDEYANDF